MILSARVPWYNIPPRPFPAKRWLETRYPFRVSPSALAWYGSHAAAPGRRLFPALVWAEGRAGGQGHVKVAVEDAPPSAGG